MSSGILKARGNSSISDDIGVWIDNHSTVLNSSFSLAKIEDFFLQHSEIMVQIDASIQRIEQQRQNRKGTGSQNNSGVQSSPNQQAAAQKQTSNGDQNSSGIQNSSNEQTAPQNQTGAAIQPDSNTQTTSTNSSTSPGLTAPNEGLSQENKTNSDVNKREIPGDHEARALEKRQVTLSPQCVSPWIALAHRKLD